MRGRLSLVTEAFTPPCLRSLILIPKVLMAFHTCVDIIRLLLLLLLLLLPLLLLLRLLLHH